MIRRRNICLLLAGFAIFLGSVVCSSTALPNNAPAPTADLSKPSGGGGPLAATDAPAVLPTQATAGPPPSEASPAPAIPESRRLTLEYPPRINAGDSDIVRLTLEVDTLGNVTPTAVMQGNQVTGQVVQVPNVYDTHNVIAEARLNLAGVETRPSDLISEPLLRGESVTFYWSVRPEAAGTYRGTVWLFLRFQDRVTREESRKPLAAQTIEITSGELLGLNGNLARLTGGVGSVIGAVLGFPFIDDVLKWLWRRVRTGV